MNPIPRASLLALAALLLTAGTAPADEAGAGGNVKLTQQQNRVVVEVGGKPFTEYYFADEEGRPYVRPYFFPVRAADGAEITSDQIRSKGDHPHHRSLWVSHGDVNGADHWAIKGTNPPKQRHVKFNKVEGDTIVQELVWEDKDGQPMLNETRTIRFHAYGDGGRGIDITSEFKAASGAVKFGDTKEAGLCSVRVVKSISDNPTLNLSTGATSTKNANRATREPGDESNVWGKEADWCDISGQVNGKTYGVAILDHPSNPLPARWHARRYGLVGANNIGASEFNKNDPHSYTPFSIEPGKPATFKYRVVVHRGGAQEAKIAEKYNEFAR
jgi:hypothetical protein